LAKAGLGPDHFQKELDGAKKEANKCDEVLKHEKNQAKR